MYAPDLTMKWALFWRQLADDMSISNAWILVGDFNMTFAQRRQGGEHVDGGARVIVVAWDLLMGRMRVKDRWHVIKSLRVHQDFREQAAI